MADDGRKALNLITRFPFTDLSRAASRRGGDRMLWLKGFVRGIPNGSYAAMRSALHGIYGVPKVLDPSPPPDWPVVSGAIRRSAKQPSHIDMCLDAGKHLFDLVRPKEYQAYEHPLRDLPIGIRRYAPIGIDYYLVDKDRAVFQFAQPRKTSMTERELQIMMSIIHHAYAVGDFSEADIEIADLSARNPRDGRAPRILKLDRDEIVSREQLQEDIDDVYSMLIAIVEGKA